MLVAISSKAQVNTTVENGLVMIKDGSLGRPDPAKYATVTATIDRKLKANPNDTTSLFIRAMLYLHFNSLIANPNLSSDVPTYNLINAKKLADRADSLNMQDIKLKVLRAQLCKELTYRYAATEKWRYNDKQLAERKRKYDMYKALANQYYDELAMLDKKNAYDYQRLKIK